MMAATNQPPGRRVRGGNAYKPQQGRLAGRAWGRHHLRLLRGAARRTPASSGHPEGDRRGDDPRAGELQRSIPRPCGSSRASSSMIETGEGIDWATAEALAFGTLLWKATSVRLSGQDVERGTFSQRHSVLTDQETERAYHPAQQHPPARPVRGHQQRRSPSSACSASNTATRWPSRMRWRSGKRSSAISPTVPRWCSTSSSPRVNASGCACPAWSACCRMATRGRGRSTPRPGWSAICSSAPRTICRSPIAPRRPTISTRLRRQMRRNFRKPLIMMTPKSLLRHKLCVSRPLGRWRSRHHLPPGAVGRQREALCWTRTRKIKRVVLCTGKVYYDLYEERERRDIKDVYIPAVEQLYPFPLQGAGTELKRFPQRRCRLVPGRAEEHGRMVLRRPRPRRRPEEIGARQTRPSLCRPVGSRLARRPATRSAHVAEQNKPGRRGADPAEGAGSFGRHAARHAEKAPAKKQRRNDRRRRKRTGRRDW